MLGFIDMGGRIRIRIKYFRLVEYVYSFAVRYVGSIDIKNGFRITHFLSKSDPGYSFVIKPNPGQDQTCRWRRIQYILVKNVLVVQWDV